MSHEFIQIIWWIPIAIVIIVVGRRVDRRMVAKELRRVEQQQELQRRSMAVRNKRLNEKI